MPPEQYDTLREEGKVTDEQHASWEGKREEFGKLLITCPDRKGIVAALAQLLYGQGAKLNTTGWNYARDFTLANAA